MVLEERYMSLHKTSSACFGRSRGRCLLAWSLDRVWLKLVMAWQGGLDLMMLAVHATPIPSPLDYDEDTSMKSH